MKKKNGFTLVELLATIIVLGLVATVTIVSVGVNMENTKKKTEKVFINSIQEAILAYIQDNGSGLDFKSPSPSCSITKNNKSTYELYSASVYFSELKQYMSNGSLKNPVNDKVIDGDSKTFTVYRDSDYVYYYYFNYENLEVYYDSEYNENGIITNLPEGKCN